MEVDKVMFENGSVWSVTTKGWAGTDKLTADDLDKDASDIPDIFRLGSKYLLPKDARMALQCRAKINTLMDRFGKKFMVPTMWYVPDRNALIVKEGLEAIARMRAAVVESLIVRYPLLKAEMQEMYPVLRTADWPTEDEIREKFNVRWLVFEISGATVKKSDPEALMEAKKEFLANLNSAYNELKDEMLKEAQIAIIEACEEITSRLLETGDKVTMATLNKPRKAIEKYENMAVFFDLDDVKAKVQEVKELVNMADAKELKSRWDITKVFGETLRDLTKDLGDLSGISSDGRAKRKIEFDRKAA
ncbi:MAG: DUF3150 domain-containing protein [Candidatus Margulisiibacteriota bacterium]|uniref:Uncharacterized protein n=1 Tax=viral metagenome TaxID=1070528 RepID=A0A6H1ZAC5_9ZZZZ